MAASTEARVCSRTLASLLMTRLTVIGEQLARRATSLIVGWPDWRRLTLRVALRVLPTVSPPISPMTASRLRTAETASFLPEKAPCRYSHPSIAGSFREARRAIELQRMLRRPRPFGQGQAVHP